MQFTCRCCRSSWLLSASCCRSNYGGHSLIQAVAVAEQPVCCALQAAAARLARCLCLHCCAGAGGLREAGRGSLKSGSSICESTHSIATSGPAFCSRACSSRPCMVNCLGLQPGRSAAGWLPEGAGSWRQLIEMTPHVHEHSLHRIIHARILHWALSHLPDHTEIACECDD